MSTCIALTKLKKDEYAAVRIDNKNYIRRVKHSKKAGNYIVVDSHKYTESDFEYKLN